MQHISIQYSKLIRRMSSDYLRDKQYFFLHFFFAHTQITNDESYLSSVSYSIAQVVHSLKTPSAVPDRLLYKQTMETSALATEKRDPSR